MSTWSRPWRPPDPDRLWDDSAAKMSANGLFSLRLNLTGVNGASSISHSSGVSPAAPRLLHGISPGDYELGLETPLATYPGLSEGNYLEQRPADRQPFAAPARFGRYPAHCAGPRRREVPSLPGETLRALQARQYPMPPFCWCPTRSPPLPSTFARRRPGTYRPGNGTYIVAAAHPRQVPWSSPATAQTVRWNVPEDLEHVLPVLFQGESTSTLRRTLRSKWRSRPS